MMWSEAGEVALMLLSALIAPIAAGLLVCVGVDCHELLNAWRQRHEPEVPIASTEGCPFVSVHLPIRAEPPEIVTRTLNALANLDYASFEVLIVSNNTPDAALWRPIEELCARLGPRFRFFDVPQLSGFKAGALNFALQHTNDAAEVVCSLDSDYEVVPDYLRRLASAFGDPLVTFVQCPQDYRDWQANPFQRMCYWEYWQFFAVGMVLRTGRNAAMLHGTMSLVRKAALLRAGGWAEWCLTEDSECGMRLLAAGGVGLYTTQIYGHGLIPFRLSDYVGQRRRWVIGGAQQVRRHLSMFLGPGGLSPTQRYLIARNWAPWVRDALVVAALPLVVASAASVLAFRRPLPLDPILCLALGAVLANHALRQWVICRLLLNLSWRDTAGAACAVVGLTWTIGQAWWRGIMRKPVSYFRTPKEAGGGHKRRFDALVETALTLIMVALAAALFRSANTSAIAETVTVMQCLVLLLPALVFARVSQRSLAAPSDRGDAP
jgi:cellulose synthase/poly-beta-1,6-N-acetylglucosamine synthase-like glycosyltransferase